MKKALITGITGQDGYYLSKLLLSKGYEVHGMIRRVSTDNTQRIKNLPVKLHYGDLTDWKSIDSLLIHIQPDEIYNLAAQSHVGTSFEVPIYTGDVTGLGVMRLLDSIYRLCPEARFYQASSSELFGKVEETPQKETTPFHPVSPYGIAKLYGYWATRMFREGFNLHASNGILFNHESPMRGDKFVTKKVVQDMVRIWKRELSHMEIGNMESKRDWGYAGDYVEAMWLMLQQDKPNDYVIATGETHSVREFIEAVAWVLGMKIQWKGYGLDEVGICYGEEIIRVNPKFYRPAEVDLLLGDATEAKEVLGWTPRTKFRELVSMMVEAEGVSSNEFSNTQTTTIA